MEHQISAPVGAKALRDNVYLERIRVVPKEPLVLRKTNQRLLRRSDRPMEGGMNLRRGNVFEGIKCMWWENMFYWMNGLVHFRAAPPRCESRRRT